MLKKATLILGVIFLLIGIGGFIPGLTAGSGDMERLFGIFMVNVWHDWVHILSGVVFLAVSGYATASRVAFQLMALLYGIVTITGFMLGSSHEVFGFIMINSWDNVLHLVLTLLFTFFGFMALEEKAAALGKA